MDREQQVRERAYAIWHAEGCPSGREQEHWDRALREVGEHDAAPHAPDNTGKSAPAKPVEAADAAPANESSDDGNPKARSKPAAKATAAKGIAKPRARTSKSKTSKTGV